MKELYKNEQTIKLYIGGNFNFFMQPEFKDVNKVHPFFSMIEKEDELVNLLKNKQDGIKVTIGNENKVDAIKNFSLITASYELSENQMGTIALLGPTRMEYRKVINILSALSNEMTDALNMWDKDDE